MSNKYGYTHSSQVTRKSTASLHRAQNGSISSVVWVVLFFFVVVAAIIVAGSIGIF